MLLTLPIREVLRATPRARIVRLDLDGHPFDYAPGQAVLVGIAGQPKWHPYSIAAAPEDARRDGWIELLVGVDERGAPAAHLTLDVGARLDVEGPRGSFTFPPNPEERRFAFIAGGTGIAPLRAMLRHALAIPHREIGLFYSARTADEFAYGEELVALAREGRIELRQTVTRSSDEGWAGGRGRIGRAELQPLVHDPATLCFVCGPTTLVQEIPRLLQELGIARQRIRIEEWG
jgi:ferredoxin-NADP reductase